MIDVDISAFYDFYRQLNTDTVDANDNPETDFPNINFDNGLNDSITISDIQTIDKLKNGKAAGLDQVTKEYIKGSSTLLIPLYHKLFNCILNTVFFWPDSWVTGCIVPIY
jgi:hypothetical protein